MLLGQSRQASESSAPGNTQSHHRIQKVSCTSPTTVANTDSLSSLPCPTPLPSCPFFPSTAELFCGTFLLRLAMSVQREKNITKMLVVSPLENLQGLQTFQRGCQEGTLNQSDFSRKSRPHSDSREALHASRATVQARQATSCLFPAPLGLLWKEMILPLVPCRLEHHLRCLTFTLQGEDNHYSSRTCWDEIADGCPKWTSKNYAEKGRKKSSEVFCSHYSFCSLSKQTKTSQL